MENEDALTPEERKVYELLKKSIGDRVAKDFLITSSKEIVQLMKES